MTLDEIYELSKELIRSHGELTPAQRIVLIRQFEMIAKLAYIQGKIDQRKDDFEEWSIEARKPIK